MKIIILGGTGFVGRNLNKIMSEHEVLNISREKGLDILCYDDLISKFKEFQPDVIFNLASHGGSLPYVKEHHADIVNDNTQMILNIYRACNSLEKTPLVVNSLSNCAYPGDCKIQEEDEWISGPVHESVFGFANIKRIMYFVSKSYYYQYGIKTVNLIFPNAFGVGDHCDAQKTHALDGMIIRMIRAKDQGDEEFEVWGTGSPIREWIYVEDTCRVLKQAMEIKEGIIEPINVAQGKGYSIKESVETIQELLDYKGGLFFNTKYVDGDPIKILVKGDFEKYFGEFKFADHRDALKKTISYYQKAFCEGE
jgi:GDP-L-fucose synthase